MPIAKIQLPDGRIARFEVAEGTTPEQVTAFASQNLGGLEKPEVAQDPSLLSKIGTATVEGLAGFTEGLGRAAVGATQFGAEMIGQEEFAGRIGQQVAKEKELEKSDSTARKVGRFIGGIAPALPVGSGAGLVLGGLRGGVASELIDPTESGTIQERVKEVAIGGGLGAATGGLIKGVKGIGGAVKRQIITTKPEDIIARGIRPEDAAPLLDQLKKGQEVVLPDIAGDEIRGLTRSVAKMSGAKDIITDALEGRSFKAVERVSNQLSKDVSPTGSYFGSLDDLAKARSEIAAPLYKKAFDKGTALDVEKNRELFEKIAPDIADARKKFRIPNVSEIKDPTSTKGIADNSIVMLDAAKKSLDDKIGKAIRQGERQEARALQQIKSELVNKLDEINPDYKKARQVFSDFSSIQNAQEQGLQFSKLRPEQITKTLKDMSVAEKDAFRIGVRESLDKVVQKTSFGSDPATKEYLATQK